MNRIKGFARMNFFKKNLLKISLVALFSFITIVVAENFHHHDAMESQDDCAFCSFIQTGSHAVNTPVQPMPIPYFLVFALFVLQFSFTSFRSVSPRGRSPPLNLR
jgi:hypothetical protein